MDAGAFDGGRHAREEARIQREGPLKHERMRRLFRRKKSERDFGDISFFAAKAGPKRGVDDGLDDVAIGSGGGRGRAFRLEAGVMACEIGEDCGGDAAGRRIGLSIHVEIIARGENGDTCKSRRTGSDLPRGECVAFVRVEHSESRRSHPHIAW
jgi:hypothetical protein